MGIVGELVGVGAKVAGKLIGKIGPVREIVDSLTDSPEKLALKVELAKLLNAIELAGIEADKEVAVATLSAEQALDRANADRAIAEVQQDDLYTKRWRPTLGYALGIGLVFNLIVFPFFVVFDPGITPPTPDPTLVGICASLLGVKVVARTFEKRARIGGSK